MIENWNQYKDLEYYPDRPCACGCGGRIKVRPSHKYDGIPIYIHNHHGKGKISPKKGKTFEEIYGKARAMEIKQKIGVPGENNPAKRPEVRKKISNSREGRPSWNEGLTKETDERVAGQAKKLAGRKKTSDHNRKNSEGMRRYYLEHPGVRRGKNNSNWQEGIGNLPYPFNFNAELKTLIRKRDDNTCQLCSKTEEQEGRNLCIHHIDYIKENLDPWNLVTLCRSCNAKVNFKREYWTKFFQKWQFYLRGCFLSSFE